MREPVYEPFECETVRRVEDEEAGLLGFLVVKSRVNGLTCGGLRIHEGVGVEELRDHARVMELKQAFIGLPRGGARAGIVAPYELEEGEKQRLANRFAELVRDELLGRRWLAAIDVGTNLDLIHRMYGHVGVRIPAPSREIDNAGYYTAFGVLRSIELCLDIENEALSRSTFAVEGFGNVGSHVAMLLHQRGGTVVALSTSDGAVYDENGLDVPRIFEACSRTRSLADWVGAERIAREDLLELDADVLCPCAADATIHSANMERIKAGVICAGANNPVTLAAEAYLHERGVLYLPDFMTNAGGALGNMVRFAGLPDTYFERLIHEEFSDKLLEVYRTARELGVPPRQAGIRMADEKFARMKESKESASGSNALFELALTVYRSGAVPSRLLRPLTYRHLRRLIAE